MATQKLFDLLKRGITTLVDPEREKRTDRVAALLHQTLTKERKDFNLQEFFRRHGGDERDLDYAREKVYSKCLARGWEDLALSESEDRSLQWVANKLNLPPATVSKLNREKGKQVFEAILAKAVDDGVVDEEEAARLEKIAAWVGESVSGFVHGYFKDQGEAFLRGFFLLAVSDGQLLDDEWNRLLKSTRRLGFADQELVDLIRPQAKAYVEHILADAKSDGELSPAEEQNLEMMLRRFQLSPEFTTYVRTEMRQLKRATEEAHQLRAIWKGNLPTLTNVIGIELRAGEMLHYFGSATFETERQRKSGVEVQMHSGSCAITDSRVVFSSPTKSFAINLRSVIESSCRGNTIELRTATKGSGIYHLGEDIRIAYPILRVAVGRANQTIVNEASDTPSRHIPRDVRQRVWQRYGARCVECGDDQYLEFDHIIPVAKGGSSTDANVQLLCRRCNSKKSDMI